MQKTQGHLASERLSFFEHPEQCWLLVPCIMQASLHVFIIISKLQIERFLHPNLEQNQRLFD